MKALIDGDIVVYSCGFASDKREKQPDGTVKIIQEPLEYALHTVKQLLNRCMERTASTDRQIFLTGKGNYREKVATIQPYKGNRDPAAKPSWYTEIKEYLVKYHDAEIVHGKEADDAMGSAQTEDTCICSIDKDMNMIPGLHYNWKRDTLYNVEPDEAILFFYTQLLTGDRTDNIVGVPGVGPKRAGKIISTGLSEMELYERVRQVYVEVYGGHADRYLMENATLLWIQREPDQLWSPPNVITKSVPSDTNIPSPSPGMGASTGEGS
jgi:hypothetical protein